MTWPVMNDAEAEATKTIARAISSGVPSRPSGTVDTSAALFGQSLPCEFDGLGEQRLPQAPVDRGDHHPFSEDLACGRERVAVTVLDELVDSRGRQLDDRTPGLVVIGR